MTNALQINTSTPFTGLLTQAVTIPTTGLYSVGLKIFLPWQTSDQPTSAANPPVRQVQTVTVTGDTAGSLNNTYFKFWAAGNAPFLVSGTWYQFYYVWYNINSAGTDPALAGGFAIAVTGATGANSTTIGGNTRTAIAAALPASGNTFAITGATSAVIMTAAQYGAMTIATDGAAPTSFAFAAGTTGSYGYTSGMVATIKQNSTILTAMSQPSPTQPLLGGKITAQLTAADTLSVITSSLSNADAGLNVVKGIVNVFQGS